MPSGPWWRDIRDRFLIRNASVYGVRQLRWSWREYSAGRCWMVPHPELEETTGPTFREARLVYGGDVFDFLCGICRLSVIVDRRQTSALKEAYQLRRHRHKACYQQPCITEKGGIHRCGLGKADSRLCLFRSLPGCDPGVIATSRLIRVLFLWMPRSPAWSVLLYSASPQCPNSDVCDAYE